MIWPKEKYIFFPDVISLAQTHFFDLEREDPGFHHSHDLDFPTDIDLAISYLKDMNIAFFRETPKSEPSLGKFRKGI